VRKAIKNNEFPASSYKRRFFSSSSSQFKVCNVELPSERQEKILQLIQKYVSNCSNWEAE
jgi:hypothetical protein